MTLVGIVPAGGSGERLGAQRPKAFVVLAGRAMLEWSVEVLQGVCDRVIVAVPASASASATAESVVGGSSRSKSVRNAVHAAPEASVYVIHDAARPLVTEELVRRCVEALGEGVDGAIAAAPVADTIKQADGRGRVVSTLERSSLWAVQTPQVFRADALRTALDADAATLAAATDDASLVEAGGGRVDVVESRDENFKVTTALDLRMAEAVLGERC
ncbi:MAG TPA: 2-C-methyl-D-erythritol 4-phosphate cytidylyltransferase [Thermoleophilaceae bacterium]|nr:2-C-methyl-D-erythritol 4-phosphate cytidylyltransferase [Thermoleophilaceae bacterium]